MQRSDLHLLILEDDPSVGKAILTALSRQGYICHWAASAEKALCLLEFNEFHGIIADCMLPTMPGPELCIQLKQKINKNIPIVLMSGIFKNTHYIDDVMRRTGAQFFIAKPFEMNDLIDLVYQCVDQCMESFYITKDPPLLTLLQNNTQSNQEKLQILQCADNLKGFDLPLVYSHILKSGFSGRLEVLKNNNISFTIDFNKGRISQLSLNDPNTYFGQLLIEMGFASAEDVELGLSMGTSQPLGLHLIAINRMSPHAIDVVLERQIMLRLGKTVSEENISLNFKEHMSSTSSCHFGSNDLAPLLSDWIETKIDLEWLKSFYEPVLDRPLLASDDVNSIHQWDHLPLVYKNNSVINSFSSRTLNDLIHLNTGSEEDTFRCIHFLLLTHKASFSTKSNHSDALEGKIQKLKKLRNKIENSSYFEVFNLSSNAKKEEIHQSYIEMAKAFHPDKLPLNAPEELTHLAEQIFNQVNQAYKTLSDTNKRISYEKKLKYGSLENAFKADDDFLRGQFLLSQGQYQNAYDLFLQLIIQYPQHHLDINIYLSWSLLKSDHHQLGHLNKMDTVKELMDQIPFSERRGAEYAYVRGLYHSEMSNYSKSYKHFQAALSLNPHFIDARRDLAKLKIRLNYGAQKSSTFKGLLSKLFNYNKS